MSMRHHRAVRTSTGCDTCGLGGSKLKHSGGKRRGGRGRQATRVYMVAEGGEDRLRRDGMTMENRGNLVHTEILPPADGL